MRPTCPKCGNRMVTGPKAASGKRRWQCFGGAANNRGGAPYCYSTTNPGAPAQARSGKAQRTTKMPIFRRTVGGVTTLLITAAQNATPAHGGFVKAMESLCNERSGDILAVPISYKNPTSRWDASSQNEQVWADEFTPYLCNQRKRLNRNLIVLGDIPTQPTAVNPLSGYDALTHGESGILAHTKLALRTIATPQSRYPKILTTTGAATVENFTRTPTGKKGEFHYTLGATLVEIKGKKFHIRQINGDKTSGDFIDLDRYYGGNGHTMKAPPALALPMGDTHVDSVDPAVDAATFGPGGIVETLNPQELDWHDLLDSYSVSHHHAGNVFIAAAKIRSGRMDVDAEVRRAVEHVMKRTTGGRKSYIVASNHIDMLTKWVVNTDPRSAPANLRFWCETALALDKATTIDARGAAIPDAFAQWGRKLIGDRQDITFLDRDATHTVAGIELGMHGDKGPNGSRGSRQNLRRIGVKSIIGHSHSPGIDEGCYQVGTSTYLKLEYTSGPSGWLNTHCIVYANGKRSLINIIDGEWRLQ